MDARQWIRRHSVEWEAFGRALWTRLIQANCLQSAATLSYTTLLSIVPLLAVGFSVLAAFPMFEPLTERIQAMILANLVPAASEAVEGHVERFIGQTAGLTAAGIAGLLVSSLLLVSAIDRALNDIWQVQQRRRALYSFMVYWTVLTLSPLLIGLSVLVSTYLDTLTLTFATLPRQLLLSLMPFAAAVLVFTFLYAAVPNRNVLVRHALIGAAVAAGLFELAKLGFSWYVAAFPSYQVIYGALAALPLFLIWMYLVWTIVLGGAVLTQTLGSYRAIRGGTLADPRMELVLAVRLLGHLWWAQRAGRAVPVVELARKEASAGITALQNALTRLEEGRVVRRTGAGEWLLARDGGTLTVLDLYREQGMRLPDAHVLDSRDLWERRLAALLEPVQDNLDANLRVPVARIYAAEEESGAVENHPL